MVKFKGGLYDDPVAMVNEHVRANVFHDRRDDDGSIPDDVIAFFLKRGLRIVRASQVRELQVSRVIARDLPAHVRGPELVRYVTRDLAHLLADELMAKVPIVWQPPHETPDHETRATVRLHVIKPRAEK